MSYVFTGTDGNYCTAFIDSLKKLRDEGRITSPRGQKTKELDHVVFEVDPRKTLYTSPKRNLNFFFLIAENLWYWSGRNSTELPSSYVRNYRQFSDEGIHQGAYGPQILEQIRYIVRALKKDPDTRQAVMTLWRPNPGTSKDTPCTISFDFKIRDNKLNLHATMRSNDAVWGNNYDMPSFAMIQLAVAGIVGVEPGKLFLTAHSYHVYERHFKLMDDLISEEWNYTEYPHNEELLYNPTTTLGDHIKAIEELLRHHYMIESGLRDSKCDLSDFYKQYYFMMELNSCGCKNDNTNYTKEIIKELTDIQSPFGNIYHDRYIVKN